MGTTRNAAGAARIFPRGARRLCLAAFLYEKTCSARIRLLEKLGLEEIPQHRARLGVIIGAQIRQSRKLLGWEPSKLAPRAKVHALVERPGCS